MGLTPTVEESLSETLTRNTAFSAALTYVSLHSANPGSTGASELASSSYARQPISFGTTPGGGQDNSNVAVSWNVQSGDNAFWYGLWTALTGGTFLGGFPLVGPPKLAVAMTTQGATVVYCPAHGLAAGQIVRMFPEPGIPGSAVPAGYAQDTKSQIGATPTTDSLTFGLTATSSRAFWLALDYSNVFNAPGVYTIPLGSLIYETVS